ncbi:MAG: hypothetical protein KDE27_20245, partial [Planctomycetes bacterium]|nr:hypothetical protein [Planctomycetota bacterium]
KVLLKFGSAHGGRGYSPFDQLDIGNHVAEIAVARGGDSFHVYVLARRSVDRDGVAKEMADGVESLRPFCAALPAGEGGVFDLVALRPLLSRDEIEAAHHAVHDFVFRYDALVLLPELHESEPLFALPGSR